jgi:hypothetical protein
MAFSTEAAQAIKSVSIPLSFSRSLTPDGVLEVPVKVAGAALNSTPGSPTVSNDTASQNAMRNARKSAETSGAPKSRNMNDGMIEQPGSALSPPGQNPQDPFSPHSTTPLNYPQPNYTLPNYLQPGSSQPSTDALGGSTPGSSGAVIPEQAPQLNPAPGASLTPVPTHQ